MSENKYKGFYEILYVVHPNTDEAGQKEVREKVQRIVTENGGQVLQEEAWGKRRLAYEIRKVMEGIYIWMYYRDLSGKSPRALEAMIHTEARVIRHAIIAQPKAKLLQDEQQAEREKAQAEKAAAEAAAAAERAATAAAAAEAAQAAQAAQAAAEASQAAQAAEAAEAQALAETQAADESISVAPDTLEESSSAGAVDDTPVE